MQNKLLKPKSKNKNQSQSPKLNCASVNLSPELYASALIYLFNRPTAASTDQEWYWDIDEPEFEASELEWTQIQTVLFANAYLDLMPYTDEQVGMGLNFLMNNAISDVPSAAVHSSVPLTAAMQMMEALPSLWLDCITPRLAWLKAPIGSGEGGKLGYVCYMWFDVWTTFYFVRDIQPWQDAMCHVLSIMLSSPCRAVQIAALHGIGHEITYLNIDQTIVENFIATIPAHDQELIDYAHDALLGRVQ